MEELEVTPDGHAVWESMKKRWTRSTSTNHSGSNRMRKENVKGGGKPYFVPHKNALPVGGVKGAEMVTEGSGANTTPLPGWEDVKNIYYPGRKFKSPGGPFLFWKNDLPAEN